MNKKLRNYLTQIRDITAQEQMRKQWLFHQYHTSRASYCEELRKEGLTGKDYSDKVVEYDSQIRNIFGEEPPQKAPSKRERSPELSAALIAKAEAKRLRKNLKRAKDHGEIIYG